MDVPARTVVSFTSKEKYLSVEYCSLYPEAFSTLPTVTETELEPVTLTLRVGVGSWVGFNFTEIGALYVEGG